MLLSITCSKLEDKVICLLFNLQLQLEISFLLFSFHLRSTCGTQFILTILLTRRLTLTDCLLFSKNSRLVLNIHSFHVVNIVRLLVLSTVRTKWNLMLKKNPGERSFCCDYVMLAFPIWSIEPTGRCTNLFPNFGLKLPRSFITL